MTFYSNEVARLTRSLYPHDDLTKHIIQSKLYIDKRFSENINLDKIAASALVSKLYIDKRFSENINLDKIAANALVSKFHFIRVFKKYYGRTPNQYLQEVRIEKAKAILQKGKTIDEACNEIGFKSKTSFISLFKKMTGLTPLAFQNKKSNFE